MIKSKQRVVNVHSAGDIESAIMRGEEQENLIGDFSQSHALPLVDGRHRDLKCISAHTVITLTDFAVLTLTNQLSAINRCIVCACVAADGCTDWQIRTASEDLHNNRLSISV